MLWCYFTSDVENDTINSDSEPTSEPTSFDEQRIDVEEEEIISETKSLSNDCDSSTTPKIINEEASLGTISHRLLLKYLGIESSGIPFNWSTVSKTSTFNVELSHVDGSDWDALRASSDLPFQKEDIFNLLVNDNRICEYDEVYATHEVGYKSNLSLNILRVNSQFTLFR